MSDSEWVTGPSNEETEDNMRWIMKDDNPKSTKEEEINPLKFKSVPLNIEKLDDMDRVIQLENYIEILDRIMGSKYVDVLGYPRIISPR